MTEERYKKIKMRIPKGRFMNYLKENCGGPFILCFILFLIVAALFLAKGVEPVANEIATYAFYFLVAGVVLQLICHLKYGSKDEKKFKRPISA
jgi:hypothetical protein